jgi:putative aldouronate transport system substrate-binding protein
VAAGRLTGTIGPALAGPAHPTKKRRIDMRRRILWIVVLAILVLAAPGFAQSGQPYELTMVFYIFGSVPKDLQLVQDEINKIALPKIGATVKLMPVSFGAFAQQMNLMLASGEKLDLMNTGVRWYPMQVSKNQLTALDELINKYGKGIEKALGKFATTAKIGGKTYAVASVRDLAANRGINMRKDMLDALGVDGKSIKTNKDVEKLLTTVKQKYPDLTPLAPAIAGNSLVDFMYTWDRLGDGFGVLPDNGKRLTVVDLTEMEEYQSMLKLVRSWYLAGLVQKDAATNKEHWSAFVKADKLFATFHTLKPGIQAQTSKEASQPMVIAELIKPMSSTDTVTNVMWSVPRNTRNAEKAVQFLNLMYSDPVVVNLFDWGIEGKHYVKRPDGLIEYPEGVDATNVGYGLNLGWLFGNQFLSYIFKGDSPTLWKDLDAFNKSALRSKATGFIFDSTPVKAEIAALTNVQNQYKVALECGILDPATALPEYREKLKAAGIAKVIVEKQKQLDAWAAGK